MRTDLTMIRGDTRTFTLDLVYADGELPDLVDATITVHAENLFDKTLTDPDLSTGEITLTIEPEDTEGTPDQRTRYAYNVQVEQADGVVLTVQRGNLIVFPDVPALT